MPLNRGACVSALMGCLFFALAASAAAQSTLPLGQIQPGRTTSDAPTEYRMSAESAGVLTVAVQGEGDLVLLVMDGDGQPVPEGRSDRDLNGDPGMEWVTVTLTEPGEYRVRVMAHMGTRTSRYQIAGSWVPFPPFARPVDPDGRPSRARALRVGESVEDSISGSEGDLVDWFAIEATAAGTFVAVTRPVDDSDGDLVLEAFLDGNFVDPVARSDQDLQGSMAAESVSVSVKAGQTVYLRVSGAFGGIDTKYRLSSTLVD